jgi:hypothetical protein
LLYLSKVSLPSIWPSSSSPLMVGKMFIAKSQANLEQKLNYNSEYSEYHEHPITGIQGRQALRLGS